MSNNSYSNWLQKCKHDPLWWIWLLSLVSPAITAVLDLAGVINRDLAPYSTINHASWVVFGAILILVAVRNKDLGEDKPMSTGLRVFCVALGVFVAGVALVLGIIPSLSA